jgi:hypothetical protein
MGKLEYYGKPIVESVNQISLKRETWLKSILLLSSSLFGILVSLQNNNLSSLQIRWCFAAAILLLGFGILNVAVALYGYVDTLVTLRNETVLESVNAHSENRALKPVAAKERKIFSVCEKIAYLSLLLSVVLLCAFSILSVFK